MPTSTLQEFRSQAVPVSGAMPEPMVQGVAVLQKSTFVTGSAEAGPKLGTANGPAPGLGLGLAGGLVLGEVTGEVLGDGLIEVLALGEVEATPGLDPRPARTMPPIVPNNRISTTPMIAGINQGGRSVEPPPPGLRATVGLRAGA